MKRPEAVAAIDTGDTAWMLVDHVVIFMTRRAWRCSGGVVRSEHPLDPDQAIAGFSLIAPLWVVMATAGLRGPGEGGFPPSSATFFFPPASAPT